MDECGWCELNSRSPTGDVIPVTRKNVVRILAGWWNQEKKNSAAREAERRAEAAYAPETGLGFRSVPDATMEIV